MEDVNVLKVIADGLLVVALLGIVVFAVKILRRELRGGKGPYDRLK